MNRRSPIVVPMLWLITAAWISACGDTPTQNSSQLDIGGTWQYSEILTLNLRASEPTLMDDHLVIGPTTCDDRGTLVINQTGSTFTGSLEQTGTCTDANGNQSDNSGHLNLSQGTVTASGFAFSDDGAPPCTNTSSTVNGTRPNRVTGRVACANTATGSFTMTR